VIPAFNQARFLPAAIESAVAQTCRDREIIVVDDGSTDDTPDVARRYGDAVRYVQQANKGLAGARNTGIEHARGEFVALLDSDDVWLPGFLEHMLGVADAQPQAAVYFSAWRYIDSAGNPLPEPPHAHAVPPSDFYRTLLRANFIVPSSVMMRRQAVVAAGLFDETFRRLEDWELWIRLLLQGHTLVGSTACHLHYRVHGESLSADSTAMEQAALALVRKHFGEDDGHVEAWAQDKRWAYAGVYRYHALLCARRRGDWDRGGLFLRKAIACDPTLARDRALFDELAWGSLPAGHRRLSETVDVDACARTVFGLVAAAVGVAEAAVRHRCRGTAHVAIASIAYGCGQTALARRYLLNGARHWPPLLLDARFSPLLARACLGGRVMGALKRLIPLSGRSR
jgi:glycosyltransferase involved in cell wall biosynthesis